MILVAVANFDHIVRLIKVIVLFGKCPRELLLEFQPRGVTHVFSIGFPIDIVQDFTKWRWSTFESMISEIKKIAELSQKPEKPCLLFLMKISRKLEGIRVLI